MHRQRNPLQRTPYSSTPSTTGISLHRHGKHHKFTRRPPPSQVLLAHERPHAALIRNRIDRQFRPGEHQLPVGDHRPPHSALGVLQHESAARRRAQTTAATEKTAHASHVAHILVFLHYGLDDVVEYHHGDAQYGHGELPGHFDCWTE